MPGSQRDQLRQSQGCPRPCRGCPDVQSSGSDELVFLDIFATVENRPTRLEWVSKVRAVTTIPFAVAAHQQPGGHAGVVRYRRG